MVGAKEQLGALLRATLEQPETETRTCGFFLHFSPAERRLLDEVSWTARVSRTQVLREGVLLAAKALLAEGEPRERRAET